MDHIKLFEDHIEHVKRAIHAKCLSYPQEEPDDLAQNIYLKLIENDYHIIRSFQGKSSFTTYLYTVINRLFLDYMRSKKGRWRPSERSKELGPIAVQLEGLMQRDGYSLSEASRILIENHHINVSETELESLGSQLPPRQSRPTEDCSEEALEDVPSVSGTLLDEVEVKRLDTLQHGVENLLEKSSANLPDEDRVILRMRFEDDIPISKIARIMKVDRSVLDRRIQKILAGFKQNILAAGINHNDVLDVLKRREG